MPRIETVPPEAATGDLAEAYERVTRAMGVPVAPTVFQLSSLRPELVSALAGLYVALFRGGELSRAAQEAIATYVSSVNRCPYCVSVHATLMHAEGASGEQVAAVRSGEVSSAGDEVAPFLPLAEKIARHAYKVTDEDVEALRSSGWSDERILEGIWIVVFFSLVNRLADSLGIGEADFEADLQGMRRAMAQ